MTLDLNSISQDDNLVIADTTSVKDLVDNLDFLTANVNTRSQEAEMRRRLKSLESTQNAMAIIERLVAYEGMLVDAYGAASMGITQPPEELPFLELFSIPNQTYDQGAQIVHELMSAVVYQRISGHISMNFSSSSYESYFDELERRGIQVSTIANTGATLSRVLFYGILSGACNAPLLLHPNKDRFLKYISDACVEDILETVESETDRILMEEVDDLSKRGILLPPLAEFVFESAMRKRTSIVESLMEVRDSKDARSFRKWLHEIQLCVGQGSRPALVEASKQQAELQKTVQKWAENLDIGLDVTHKYTTFGLGLCTDAIKKLTGIKIELPGISFKVKDPVLNPKRHFRFIASWYRI